MIVTITPDTLESVMDLAAEFLAESRLDLEWNKPHWLATWRDFLARGVGVMFADEERNGWIAALVTPEVITGRLAAQEIYWYVRASHRKSGLGVELFDALEAEARRRGCVRVSFGSLANLPPAVGEFYVRRGYTPVETHYSKDLTHA